MPLYVYVIKQLRLFSRCCCLSMIDHIDDRDFIVTLLLHVQLILSYQYREMLDRKLSNCKLVINRCILSIKNSVNIHVEVYADKIFQYLSLIETIIDRFHSKVYQLQKLSMSTQSITDRNSWRRLHSDITSYYYFTIKSLLQD